MEHVQRRDKKEDSVDGTPLLQRLRELGLFSLEKRRLQGGLRAAYLQGGCKKEGDRLFSRVCCDRTRGKGFKLKEKKIRFYIKKIFTIRAVRQWHRLP